MKNEDKMYDVIIVGAGPIGLSCAIAACKKNLNYLVLEKGLLVNSIYGYPTNMNFFSTAPEIEIGGIPFTSTLIKPTRLEALQYYRRVAEFYDLNIKLETTVDSIQKVKESFQIKTKERATLKSKKVVLATGYFDNPNMLNVPGENLTKVSHFYKEAHTYYKKKVLVLGGRNSAIEAALEIYRTGGRVTMVHRKTEFDQKVKYWIKPDIENRIKEGSITGYMASTVKRISKDSVVIEKGGDEIHIKNDYVLALTGFTPNTTMMKKAGVDVNEVTLVPDFNPDTFETNVKGFYIAGTISAGREANKIFIENGRLHATPIMQSIAASF
jgi:thioredoxin reductase (NADPH)